MAREKVLVGRTCRCGGPPSSRPRSLPRSGWQAGGHALTLAVRCIQAEDRGVRLVALAVVEAARVNERPICKEARLFVRVADTGVVRVGRERNVHVSASASHCGGESGPGKLSEYGRGGVSSVVQSHKVSCVPCAGRCVWVLNVDMRELQQDRFICPGVDASLAAQVVAVPVGVRTQPWPVIRDDSVCCRQRHGSLVHFADARRLVCVEGPSLAATARVARKAIAAPR